MEGGGGVKFFDVSICNDYRLSDVFSVGDKIFQGVKIHQVATSETVNVLNPTFDIHSSISAYQYTSDSVTRDPEKTSRHIG